VAKNKKKINQSVANTPSTLRQIVGKEIKFTASESKHFGFEDDSTVVVNMKYYQKQFECLSDWDKPDLKSLSEVIDRIQKMTWNMVYSQGGKSNKTGLGYTTYEKLPESINRPTSLSEDIGFFELRVTEKARIHGFRSKSNFFLVWLDRNHSFFPE